MLGFMVKERMHQNFKHVKDKIVTFILSEKSNETGDVGAWIFWSIMIGLLAYSILKVGFGVGFDNISDLYAGLIIGNRWMEW